jgi:hypothetical protein
MFTRVVVAGLLVMGAAGGALAAHGGGGGGGGAAVSGGGGGGEEAKPQRKPVDRKKEFSCFQYLMARAQMDPVCRILFDATQERADIMGLTEERFDKIREKLRDTRNGLRYLKLMPESGPSEPPNWCELKRKIGNVDEIIRLEKKRAADAKAEEALSKKDSQKK